MWRILYSWKHCTPQDSLRIQHAIKVGIPVNPGQFPTGIRTQLYIVVNDAFRSSPLYILTDPPESFSIQILSWYVSQSCIDPKFSFLSARPLYTHQSLVTRRCLLSSAIVFASDVQNWQYHYND